MDAIDKNYSWMQIHTEGNNYVLYLYNKKGLKKPVFKSKDLERVQDAMEKRNKLNESIRIALSEAVQKALTDPEIMKRLQRSK